MDLIERDITLTCVSNSVGGKYVGGARWLGVRLTDLLDLAGVGSEADQIFATDFDGMTISTPLALATDGRDAMLAIGMNGEVLPREHGFPARVVIPGLYGFISATKWVTRLTLTTYDDKQAYWTERDWATDAPIKISSRIDTPKPLAELDRGREHHRRRRLGPAERRRRQGAGPRRRRCVDRRRARPECRQRLLAPVVLPLGRRAPARTTSPPGSSTATATSRAPPGPTRSPRARAASRSSSSRSSDQSVPWAATNTRTATHPLQPLTGRFHPMKRSSLRRTTGAAAAVLALSLSLAACGDDADEPSSGSDDTSGEAPTDDGGDEAEGAGAQTFGEGCAAIPTSGKGSFDGMVTDPVATAASNNPLLSTLVTAVGECRPGRHAQRRRGPDGVRADQRRVRRDPRGGPRPPSSRTRTLLTVDPHLPRGRRAARPRGGRR